MLQCPVHSFTWEIYAILLFSLRFTFFFMIYVYRTYEGCACPECVCVVFFFAGNSLSSMHALGCVLTCFLHFFLDCCSRAWVLLFIECFSEKHFLLVCFICIRFNLLHRAFSEGDFTGCEMSLLPSHLIIL